MERVFIYLYVLYKCNCENYVKFVVMTFSKFKHQLCTDLGSDW
jgi:hypothetical protein